MLTNERALALLEMGTTRVTVDGGVVSVSRRSPLGRTLALLGNYLASDDWIGAPVGASDLPAHEMLARMVAVAQAARRDLRR